MDQIEWGDRRDVKVQTTFSWSLSRNRHWMDTATIVSFHFGPARSDNF
jgi:hypothetical protein